MSAVEPQHDAPPVGEEIHLPGPSALPLLTAVGITVALVGVTLTWVLTIAGAILALVCVVRWVAQARRDVGELPLSR
jgi:tetrahydromethanopterin S-methyltransferase subunit C